MSYELSEERIPEERLAEQWYSLLHSVIGQLQAVYRRRSKSGELTQKKIARRLGFKHPEVVSRCLAGQRNMTLRTLHNLARAMDCRLDISVTPLSELKQNNRSKVLMAEQEKLRQLAKTGSRSANDKGGDAPATANTIYYQVDSSPVKEYA